MYNVVELQKAFAGLVGFYQPNDPQYPRIDADLAASTSGKFVQRAHSLCTIENLYNAAPEFKSFVYPAFVANETNLQKGDTRSYQNKNYEYTGSGAAGLTPTNNADWKLASPFSRWLRELYSNACSNLVSDLMQYKKLTNAGKSILDSQVLYSGFGMLVDRVIKRNRFVGIQLFTSRNQNVSVNIVRLGFQVDQTQTVNFYLYHSSQTEPVKVIPMEITKAFSFAWLDLTDVKLSFMNANQNATGVFYLGYYEADLQGQAISKRMNLGAAPCLACGNFDVNAYNAWSQYTAIASIYVPTEALDNDKNIFDVSKVTSVNDSNFGINLSISVACDLTKFFITNKMSFADALAMRLAVEVLNELAFSTRLNAISATVKGLAGSELNPKPESGSFLTIYYDALKALNYDFSGFDANCLPCAKRGGISYETI